MSEATEAEVARLRLALQGCTSHGHGPVIAFGLIIEAHRDGRIDDAQFRSIGEGIVAASRARHAELVEQGRTDEVSKQMRREELVVAFTSHLFGLGS